MSRRTFVQESPFGFPSNFGMAGLRIPRAMPVLHRPIDSAYRKKVLRAWQFAATELDFIPSARFRSRNTSISSNVTLAKESCRSATHSRNAEILAP
jgi:hypothetical protein